MAREARGGGCRWEEAEEEEERASAWGLRPAAAGGSARGSRGGGGGGGEARPLGKWAKGRVAGVEKEGRRGREWGRVRWEALGGRWWGGRACPRLEMCIWGPMGKESTLEGRVEVGGGGGGRGGCAERAVVALGAEAARAVGGEGGGALLLPAAAVAAAAAAPTASVLWEKFRLYRSAMTLELLALLALLLALPLASSLPAPPVAATAADRTAWL